MTEKSLESIFLEKGALLSLSMSVWTASLKIKKSEKRYVTTVADERFISNWKTLIEHKALENIEYIRNSARHYVYSKSLPFPMDNALFVPKEKIDEIEAKLQDYQKQFWEEVTEFEKTYADHIKQAKIHLNELFNPADYPIDVDTKFNFDWIWITLAVPDTVKDKQREMDRFHSVLEQFQYDAITALRDKFLDMVSKLGEKMVAEKKVFHSSTVTNLQEFIDEFRLYNVMNDSQLQEQVARVEQIIRGKNPDALRDDPDLRTAIGRQLDEVKNALESNVIEKPRRKIIIDATP